ncbi:hypothetical protein LENED_009776 [Lentinula edodes]|uniref:Uncharacterized protein n=1 Tax=Lentinula edodes TaxID=5353 RepID=A0A1Q3EKX4_LENED|nr:hypothetical protein LENED_009776 [Lentinula edodes]
MDGSISEHERCELAGERSTDTKTKKCGMDRKKFYLWRMKLSLFDLNVTGWMIILCSVTNFFEAFLNFGINDFTRSHSLLKTGVPIIIFPIPALLWNDPRITVQTFIFMTGSYGPTFR